MPEELIVLCDENGQPTGTAEKLATHHVQTPLHLGFSCYLFNDRGQLLLTQRATSKKVWPDVWTNSFCGHPLPGESFPGAISRRAEYELGLGSIDGLQEILGEYQYRTPPYNGIIEHEFCPVWAGRIETAITPNPEEVQNYRWIAWSALKQEITDQPDRFSYWLKEQMPLLQKNTAFKEYLQT